MWHCVIGRGDFSVIERGGRIYIQSGEGRCACTGELIGVTNARINGLHSSCNLY